MKKTQHEKIVDYLATGKQLTVNQAVRLGVTNLSARIHELRNYGFNIYTNTKRFTRGIDAGKKVTCYRLAV